MIANRKYFYGGMGLLIVFGGILIAIFSPIFGGQNGLEYLDNLYNSISKGSAYYIPKVKAEAGKYDGSKVNLTIDMHGAERAGQTLRMFAADGADATLAGNKIKIAADLGNLLKNILRDSDLMYFNKGQALSQKYGLPEKETLYNWWIALIGMEKDLKAQKKFDAAQVVERVRQKAVESSYNYYGIEPQKISDRMGIVVFSLIFYVVYTLWYGYAILFLLEGWGLRLDH